jgi:hypothetical protein
MRSHSSYWRSGRPSCSRNRWLKRDSDRPTPAAIAPADGSCVGAQPARCRAHTRIPGQLGERMRIERLQQLACEVACRAAAAETPAKDICEARAQGVELRTRQADQRLFLQQRMQPAVGVVVGVDEQVDQRLAFRIGLATQVRRQQRDLVVAALAVDGQRERPLDGNQQRRREMRVRGVGQRRRRVQQHAVPDPGMGPERRRIGRGSDAHSGNVQASGGEHIDTLRIRARGENR